MAYFRCGGAGIPSSLKTGMNNILNKKFGTVAQDYPPADWPDDVNLLGLLEEKTVSGNIAQFSDGADDVPIVSCECEIAPDVDGTALVKVWHGKKNLYPTVDDSTLWERGAINVDTGENMSASASYHRTKGYIPIFGGSSESPLYRLVRSGIINSGNSDKWRFFRYDKDKNYLGYTNTTSSFYYQIGKTRYIRIRYDDTYVSFSDPQLEILPYDGTAPTPTQYQPFFMPVEIPIILGRTVHGGKINITNGTGTETCSTPTALNSLTWNKVQISGNGCFVAYLADGYVGQVGGPIGGDCSTYDLADDSSMPTDQTIYFGETTSDAYVIIRDDQYSTMTGEEFAEVVTGNIVYELAETEYTTFMFDPVPLSSYLGDNSIWADTGDINELIYRSAGTMQQYPNAEEATF